MTNKEKYNLLANGEVCLASNMAIIPRQPNFTIDQKSVKKALEDSTYFKLLSFETNKNDTELSPKNSFNAEIEYLGQRYDVTFSVSNTEELDPREFGFANHIDAESIEIARTQPYYLDTSMCFGENVLASFHLQLKILYAVVPSACLIIDFMSYRVLSAKWLAMTASSSIAPSPDYLYTLHCVYDYDESRKTKRYWLHTHGLHRCGCIELEMLDITRGSDQMHTLMNMAVRKFLFDKARERERFSIGYDGMGINLCWLRWEDALKDFPRDILGGIGDRQEDGDIHADPSGVLFAVEDGNMVSPQIYAQTLAENPIYYVTSAETDRMSALAKERFNIFREVFEKKFIKSKIKRFFNNFWYRNGTSDPGWDFLVKLGLPTNASKSDDEKEHLWFEVISIQDDRIEGRLINKPYWINGLKGGDTKKYPIDLLTDWIIYSPDTTYTTDSIYDIVY